MMDRYQALIRKNPIKISDISFVNMFVWNTDRDYRFSTLYGNLLILCNYHGEEVFMPFVGYHKPAETLIACFKYLQERGQRPVFRLVPEDLIEALSESEIFDKLIIEEDRNNHDYVYNISSLANLEGNKYAKKRNNYNRIVKDTNWEFRKINHGLVHYCLEFQSKWMQKSENDEDYHELDKEDKAISIAFDNYHKLKLIGAVLYIDNKIQAYTVAEKLNNDTVIVHFEKGNRDIRGTYQAINKLFCDKMLREFVYANRQQDLGNEGLRFAKESYKPAFMVKKFTISIDEKYLDEL